ncbi:Asp23/Gls24 family envelope stress response protein [Desulfoscipio sp. XC116]|uniref:Asp23/Gls24 family envelope stress response protein n=1 Tax=Desulfoscipio sp. XC116 TaxID=3144975 RepID=UPI00325AFF4F
MVMSEEKNSCGSIRIADDVVRIIAGLAATEVPGVVSMSGGVVGGITEKLGRKNLSKGVKVEVGEKEAAVDLFIVVEYGSRIPDVAAKIQDAVKGAVEKMTGLAVVEVNVNVQGVAFANELNEEEGNNNRVK